MKTLSLKSLYTIIGSLTIVFFILLIYKINHNSNYKENVNEFNLIQNQIKQYNNLKEEWSVKSSDDDFNFFKTYPKLILQEKRGDKYHFEFANLSPQEFDNLSNKILNSMLIIKKLTLTKNETSKGSIIVEFES